MASARRGCQTCRKRRVKCDIVQPVCGRCAKASRECNWDSGNHQGLLFKNENAFAEGQSRRPKRSLQEDTNASTTSIDATVSFPIDVLSFTYYVRNFLFQPDDLPDFGHGYTVYVLQQWSNSKPDSSLQLAIYSLAHVLFGREKKLQKAIDQAAIYHAQSIKSLEDQIPGTEDVDSVLITLMLLGNYENAIHDQYQHTSYWRHHDTSRSHPPILVRTCQAATVLLHQQQHGMLKGNLALKRAVRRSMIKNYILYGMDIPHVLTDGSLFGETGPMLELDLLVVQTARLQVDSLALVSERSRQEANEQHWEGLLIKVTHLDDALAAWTHDFPGEPGPTLHSVGITPTPNRDNTPQGVSVDRHFSHAYASVCNIQRAARLMAISVRDRCLSSNKRENPPAPVVTIEQRDQFQQTVGQIIEELCTTFELFLDYSIPLRKGFEEITPARRLTFSDSKVVPKMAAFLAWPLAVALSTETIEHTQKARLKDILETVADSLHDPSLRCLVENRQLNT